MRGAKADLQVDVDAGGAVIRQAQWGEINVALESFQPGIDTTPLFKGLPDDRCQCPHWGYVISGRVRVTYTDHEEVLSAGDVYSMPPGHTTFFEEPTEIVEFSPLGEYTKTIEVAARNMAAMIQG
jgi:hypothetical protein